MTNLPIVLSEGAYMGEALTIPPDAFYCTWQNLQIVAAFACIAGMFAGAAIMYVRLYLNGEIVKRAPHRQRSNPISRDLPDEDDDAEEKIEA